ncbi:hypothetical protein BTM500_00940 [Helicobacter pylori]
MEAAEKGNISHCEKNADTEGKQNLFEVLKATLDKVSKLNKEEVNERLEALLEMVLMRLEEPDSGRAIRTFQSVNDRGVPLLLLDKLKSLLIYYLLQHFLRWEKGARPVHQRSFWRDL